jgi:hypothetical protein
MMPQKEQKSIKNKICAYNGCARLATTRVTLPIGFSAKFCGKCADLMIEEGLEKEG